MAKMILILGLGIMIWMWWRGRKAGAPMGLDEARQLLGVKRGADAETIRAAHRRLVAAVHPDKGGSAELTRRINAARDTLLRG